MRGCSYFLYYIFVCLFKVSQRTLLYFLVASFGSESGCKGKRFISFHQIFFEVFSNCFSVKQYFEAKSPSGRRGFLALLRIGKVRYLTLSARSVGGLSPASALTLFSVCHSFSLLSLSKADAKVRTFSFSASVLGCFFAWFF